MVVTVDMVPVEVEVLPPIMDLLLVLVEKVVMVYV
jgi:hypothetical protein